MCHAEQPGPCCRQVGGHVVEATPSHEHHIADDVLSVRWMDPPLHEAEQVDVDSIEQCPEALFATLVRDGGVHNHFLSTTAEVCRRSAKLFPELLSGRDCRRGQVLEDSRRAARHPWYGRQSRRGLSLLRKHLAAHPRALERGRSGAPGRQQSSCRGW